MSGTPYPLWLLEAIECTASGQALPEADLPRLAAATRSDFEALAHHLALAPGRPTPEEQEWQDMLRSQLTPAHEVPGLEDLLAGLCEQPEVAAHVRAVQAQGRMVRVVDVLAVQLHDWPETRHTA